MAPLGFLWLHMTPYGSQRLHMALYGLYGYLWLPLFPYCSQWLPLAQYGFQWLPIAQYGSQWLSMAQYGSIWIPIAMISFGLENVGTLSKKKEIRLCVDLEFVLSRIWAGWHHAWCRWGVGLNLIWRRLGAEKERMGACKAKVVHIGQIEFLLHIGSILPRIQILANLRTTYFVR
jgi:hypothetical protein